ncbi:MAG: thiamine phosphate synthase [Magnetococcales bacterium]|nr:thiamine phosphate synthase [Magnetococcales bacterium]MBF0150956.1 thiamine phosphate synthase [Magnetococcales bacterium]MBF0172242.1 thiamine phosphate synthase [Magnetococcales bacterium]MBF0346264.1 thiamine phosphate synthase [Magnetococcales bacterium]MBF0631543.1 thiamine phosphate synthase [Magnetococcales bacterium]
MKIPRLLLITDRHLTPNLTATIAQAVAGGVDAILLREKDLDDPALTLLAQTIQNTIAPSSAQLLISARPRVARAIGAAGVHLPRDGLPIPAVRALLGPSRIIGRSCHDLASARHAFAEGADFITLSPLFPTRTHPDTPPLGLASFASMVRNLNGPVLALGGITADNVHLAMTAGAHGIALIRGIIDQDNPARHAEKISSSIKYFISG